MLLIEKNDQIYSKSNSFAQRAVEPQVAFHRHRAHTHFRGHSLRLRPEGGIAAGNHGSKMQRSNLESLRLHHRIMGIQRPAVQVGFKSSPRFTD